LIPSTTPRPGAGPVAAIGIAFAMALLLAACGDGGYDDAAAATSAVQGEAGDEAATALGQARHAPIPSTPTRPQLTRTQARDFSMARVLDAAGPAGALVSDGWNPLADPLHGERRPRFHYQVDPARADAVRIFATVQAAVNQAVVDIESGTLAARRVYIRVAPGSYDEVVYVPAAAVPITLWGDGRDPAATRIHHAIDQGLPGADYAARLGSVYAGTTASIAAFYNSCAPRATIGTGCSAVMWVRNHGFQLRNLTVENSYDESRGGTGLPHQSSGNHQAVALEVDGADRVHIERVHLLGNQDTAYFKSATPASTVRVFVNKSLITGDVDFIFGRATVFFRDSEIRWVGAPRAAVAAYITAPSTNLGIPYGFVFDRCRFTSDGQGLAATGAVTLGRQWFESVRCSPYGNNRDACIVDPTNTTDSTTSLKQTTLEAVGKVAILRSQMEGHLRAANPWADWNSGPANAAYRLVQYSSDDFWTRLVEAGKDPAALGYTQPVPAQPFLAEFGNHGTGSRP
jgi:pectinesterase